MVSEELLQILVCPEDKSPVKVVDRSTIDAINAAIAAGKQKNRGGETVDAPIEGGLLRQDGKYLYPIRDDIPIMLIDEAIPM